MKILFIIFAVFCVYPNINKRVLLNAEPFGFGPSAAIAQIFPYLRSEIKNLSYIGIGHTLDLQTTLPYNFFYDYDAADKETMRKNFASIARKYDVFMTACNFELAVWAKKLGLKTIIYDPLAWYWKQPNAIIREADLYIAQNFFGVDKRLATKSFPKNSVIIPPLVKECLSCECDNFIFMNLGGLFNPYLKKESIIKYAKILIANLNKALKDDFVFCCVANTVISENISGLNIKTVQPFEVLQSLKRCKIALMTSGLGNIYEAAAMKKNVIWLPPANDSQGQQIKLLLRNNINTFSVDWHEIFEDQMAIDYFDVQESVLDKISSCMERLATDFNAQYRLIEIIKKYIHLISLNNYESDLSKLIDLFGHNGVEVMSREILSFIQNLE